MNVEALFLGAVRSVEAAGSDAWWDREWQTGFYKERQEGRCWLGYEGFRGDAQADRRHHGGPDKAVCVYAAEHYPFWRAALGAEREGIVRNGDSGEEQLPYGAFGENLTTCGLLEETVCLGDVFRLGEALVQVSQPRQPCWKLARRWRVKDLTLRVERTGLTGFYFRVLEHGLVGGGDRLELAERLAAEWTISRCNRVMHHEKTDVDAARDLARCRWLSASWKDSLHARAQRGGEDGGAAAAARVRQP